MPNETIKPAVVVDMRMKNDGSSVSDQAIGDVHPRLVACFITVRALPRPRSRVQLPSRLVEFN